MAGIYKNRREIVSFIKWTTVNIRLITEINTNNIEIARYITDRDVTCMIDKINLIDTVDLSEFECPICLDITAQECITLSCNHSFHKQCVVEWINRKGRYTTCPLCKESILTTLGLELRSINR